MTAPATCSNVRPGETEPCGKPAEDESPSRDPTCAECGAAAAAILAAAVALLVERAAQMEAAEKAA